MAGNVIVPIKFSDESLPLYQQIARHLEAEILSTHQPGDWLSSETELARRFGVNRHTLRRAVDELVQSGLVERRVGRGIRVLAAYLDYAIHRGTRFTETLQALGRETENELLFIRVVSPSAGVRERLSLIEPANVIWIESLRRADGDPICLISHYLPYDLFSDLRHAYTGGSLHSFLTHNHGCELVRQESLITAVMPLGQDSRRLLAPQNKPLLRVKSVNIDARSGRPVEYSISRFRSDRIQLRINP